MTNKDFNFNDKKRLNQKGLIWLVWLIGGLIVLGALTYGAFSIFVHPTTTGLFSLSNDNNDTNIMPTDQNIIVEPAEVAVIIPAVTVVVPTEVITPDVPQVIFIGITTIDPLDLSKNQDRSNNIFVTFTEAMDSSTINKNTFMVKGPNNVNLKGSITYDTTKKVWAFNPTDRLISNTEYNVEITTDVKGISGNSLEENFVWSFTTIHSSSGGSSSASDTAAPTFTSEVTTLTDHSAIVTITLNESAKCRSSATDINYATMLNNTTSASFATTQTFTFNQLTPGTDYNKFFQCIDIAGNVSNNTDVTRFVTINTNDTTNPIVTLSVSSITRNSVILNVRTNEPTTCRYRNIDLNFDSMSNSTDKNTTWIIPTKSWTLAGLDALTDYNYYVACRDSNNNDGNNLISLTTLNALPSNPTAPVMGELSRFVIIASQKITTTSGSVIDGGDIVIEDQARSYYEGFTTGINPGQFIELTNGLSYAHDDIDSALIPAPYASTIAFIEQTKTDLGIAYNYLATDPNPSAATQVCPTELGDLTLTRGVYKTSENVTIQTGTLYLDANGDPDSVWIFSIDGTLTTGAPGGSIVLQNGALAKNVYWRIAGITSIGTGTIFKGNVFSYEQVNALTGANITGRLFSVIEQVTLDANPLTKAS
jgi:hypothetical protein